MDKRDHQQYKDDQEAADRQSGERKTFSSAHRANKDEEKSKQGRA